MSTAAVSPAGWRRGALYALYGALILAAMNTFGDFVWTHWIPSHRWYYGLAHGTILFLSLGVYLGFLGGSRRSFVTGALGGPLAGLAAAASFYAFAPVFGYAAMFLSWVLLWLLLGLLPSFIFRDGESLARSGLRGLSAALFSGLAFYAISGIWFRPDPGGPNYPYHFLCWTVAFLPALLPLLLKRPAWSFASG